MKAKKLPFTADLHTAATADHPQSPSHRGRAGMSGRVGTWHKPEGHAVAMGGRGEKGPKILAQPPRGRQPVMAPNGGSTKPGRKGGY